MDHRTCFLVKYFEISQIPTRVFVLVKSESYKNMGYSCAVLTTAGCCVYKCRSLFTVIAEKTKITRVQFTHCYKVFPYSVTFSNLKPRLLDSLFNLKRPSGVAKTKLFAGDCRENRLNVFIFLRRSCKDDTQ